MKKLIAGLFAAAMLAAGLVTVGGNSPASAACTPSKYNPSACPVVIIKKPAGVGTSPKNAPKVKLGKVKTIKVTFSAPAGTKATIQVINGGRVGKAVKPGAKGKSSKPAKATAGQSAKVKLPKMTKKGVYKIIVKITPVGGVTKTTVYYIKVV